MAKKKAKKRAKNGKRKMSPAQKAALAKGRAAMAAKRAGKPAKAKRKSGKRKSKAKRKTSSAVAVVVHKTKSVARRAAGKVRSMKAGKMLKSPIIMKIAEGPIVGAAAWGSAKALSYLPVKNPVAKAGAQALIGAVLSMALSRFHPLAGKAGDGIYHAGIFGLQKAAFGAEAMAGEEDYSFAMMGEEVIQVTPAELASMQGEEEYSIAGTSESFAGTSESFAGVGGNSEWRVAG